MLYNKKLWKVKIKKFRPNPDLKLMDQVCEVLRYYHYAYRTEQAYCQWIRRIYIIFLGARDVERFLSHLATQGKVSASTQRQAFERYTSIKLKGVFDNAGKY